MKKPNSGGQNHFFDTGQTTEELGAKSIRGGFNTMAAEGIAFFLRFGSTIVLARLLMPEHFGLIGMVTAIFAIAERFKDLGLSTATVQRKEITHEQVTTLFWINTAFGAIVTLLIVVTSPAIARFYGDQRLISVSLVLSSSFFFGGLTVQHQALLRRQMRFGRLAFIQILSTLLSVSVSIWLAWQGFGYWALVWKEVVRSICSAAATYPLCPWRPSLAFHYSDVGSMLRFGKDIASFNIIFFLSRNVDHILIGRFWGTSPLGFYRQANQLISATISQVQYPIDSVAEPLLSALQKEPERYRDAYGKIISLLSLLMMPLVMYLIVYSRELIQFLLGDKWIESADILRMLAISAFIQPIANTCGFVMVTCGKSARYVRWGVLSAVATISAFMIGAFWGPLGVATAYAICTYVTFLPFLWFAFRGTPVSIVLFLKAISIPAITSLLLGVFLSVVAGFIVAPHDLLTIPISLFLAILVYLGMWLVFPGGKSRLIEYYSYLLVALKIKEVRVIDD